MRALLFTSGADHQTVAAMLMAEGLRRHGYVAELAKFDELQTADLYVTWGYSHRAIIAASRDNNIPVLALERGAVQPRMEWYSCGFNGHGGMATYPACCDGGTRWEKHFAHHLMPWRANGKYVLVCGQPARFDANALNGKEIHDWSQTVIDQLVGQGHKVRYRPHPDAAIVGDHWLPLCSDISVQPLAHDLAEAKLIVVYNSGCCVEAALAGIPIVTYDKKAMAWAVSTHDVTHAPITPDRTGWCHDLAWAQWRPEEVSGGAAWDILKDYCVGPLSVAQDRLKYR